MLVSPSIRGRGKRTMSPAANTLSAAFMYCRGKKKKKCNNKLSRSLKSFNFTLSTRTSPLPVMGSPDSFRKVVAGTTPVIDKKNGKPELKTRAERGANEWCMTVDTNPLQLPPYRLQESRQTGWWPLWPFHPRQQFPSLQHWGRTSLPSPRASEVRHKKHQDALWKFYPPPPQHATNSKPRAMTACSGIPLCENYAKRHNHCSIYNYSLENLEHVPER